MSFSARVQTQDPLEHEAALAPWQVRVEALAGGPFDAGLTVLRTDHLIVYRETGSTPCRLSGAAAEELFIFGGSAPERPPLRYCRRELDQARVGVSEPAAAADAIARAGRNLWGIFAHPEVVHRLAEEFEVELPAAVEARGWNVDPRWLGDFGSRLTTAIETHAESASLEDPTTRDSLEASILRGLFAVIRTNLRTPPAPPGSRSLRSRALARALELIDASRQQVRVPEVATAAGVSVRTLEYAFREALGVTPKRYLLLNGLARSRRQLAEADPQESTVQQIARHWGFSHLGRFSGEYRRMFGESPSETLRGPARTSPVTLRI